MDKLREKIDEVLDKVRNNPMCAEFDCSECSEAYCENLTDNLLELFTQTSEQNRKAELLAMLPEKKDCDCTSWTYNDANCLKVNCDVRDYNKRIDEITERIERGGE